MSSIPRRRGGRGSDFGRRDQSWGSPRSGSPGSPGVNGSPRTGRRDHRDRRLEVQPTDHDTYVEYLKRTYTLVSKACGNAPIHNLTYGMAPVTFYKDSEYNPREPATTSFDLEKFFEERQEQQRQGLQSTPSQQQIQNSSSLGLPS